MKKILVVLTILVLVAGFAFAAVTGTVEARYAFDFDGDDTGVYYGIYGTNSEVKFTLSTESVTSAGSNKPYATVTVNLALEGGKIAKNSSAKELVYDGYKFGELAADAKLTAVLKLSDFRIVGENWEVNFLKAVGVGNYAKSAWETDYSADKKPLDAPWSFKDSKGITVTYEDYKVGVHVARTPNGALGGYSSIDLRTESKELTVAEGVTLQAAGALGYTKVVGQDAKVNFGLSVKGAYASDKVSVSAAVDLQKVADKFDADVAAKLEVSPVTVDAYYATEVTTYVLDFSDLFDDDDAVLRITEENLLSVRAIVDVEKVAPSVPVKVTLYGQNLINDERLLGIKEEGKFGKISEDAQFGIYPSFLDDATVWFANGTVGYDVLENLTVDFGSGVYRIGTAKDYLGLVAFKLGAEYKAEKFTVDGGIYMSKAFINAENEHFDSAFKAGFKASISSDKIVDNAVLSATLKINKNGSIDAYELTRSFDDLLDAGFDFYDESDNSLVLSCKVSF